MRSDVATFLADLALEGRPVTFEDVFQSAAIAGHRTRSGYDTSSIREALRLGYARIMEPVRIELTAKGCALAAPIADGEGRDHG